MGKKHFQAKSSLSKTLYQFRELFLAIACCSVSNKVNKVAFEDPRIKVDSIKISLSVHKSMTNCILENYKKLDQLHVV